MNFRSVFALTLASLVFSTAPGLAATFDTNVPLDVKSQMMQDLDFMATIKGSSASPLHQEIYGTMDGQSYTSFFNQRVKTVGLNDCGNGNAVACVIPLMDSSKMWLTQNYIKFSHPAIARLMVVYHEARHTEWAGWFYGHAKCPVPFVDDNGQEFTSIWTGAPLAGEPACDVTAKGSYGSSTILLKNISKYCETCSEKVKMDAGIYAADQLNRITDAASKKQMQQDVF